MRYIKIVLDTEYCGTKEEIYIETDMTNEQLNEYVHVEAVAHSEQYDWMVFGWDKDAVSYAEETGISVEEAEDMLESYYQEAQANSYWEEVTREEYEENKED